VTAAGSTVVATPDLPSEPAAGMPANRAASDPDTMARLREAKRRARGG
jgi:hypothetical protein